MGWSLLVPRHRKSQTAPILKFVFSVATTFFSEEPQEQPFLGGMSVEYCGWSGRIGQRSEASASGDVDSKPIATIGTTLMRAPWQPCLTPHRKAEGRAAWACRSLAVLAIILGRACMRHIAKIHQGMRSHLAVSMDSQSHHSRQLRLAIEI